MELKIEQELDILDQEPLFLVLLDLRKEYDTVDQERLIMKLYGYSVIPRLCGLLKTF